MRLFQFGEKPDGDEGKKLQALKTNFKAADARRRLEEPVWLQNIGFLEGKQWESYASDVRRNRKVELHAPSAKVRAVSNLIFPIFRQTQSSLRANAAKNIAIAATEDEDDVQAAELATRFIDSRYYANDEFNKRFYESGWKMTCGCCFRHTYWDPDADGLGIDGNPMPGAGEIVSEVKNPFQVWVSPWVSSEGDIPWVILAEVRSVDEINDIFKPSRKVTEDDEAAVSRNMDSLLAGVIEGRESTGVEKRKGSCILYYAFHAPDTKNPTGKYFCWTEDVLLREGPLPDGFLGLIRKDWFPIPGRIYPLAFVTPMIPIQREINVIMSQLVQMKNNQLAGHLMVRGDGVVTQDYALDSEGRKTAQKVVRVPLGVQDVQFMQYNLQAGEAEVMIQRLWDYLKLIGGQQDQDLGASTKARTYGETLVLQEATQTGMTLFRANEDQYQAHVDEQILQLAKEYYIVPRLLKDVGSEYKGSASAFMGSDFLDTTDVRPKPAPMISETMKAQMIQQLAAPPLALFDWSGTPDQVYGKVETLLNSGIPDIREEVEKRLDPMSIDDLRKIASEYRRQALIAQTLQAKAMVDGIQQQANQQESMGDGSQPVEEPQQPQMVQQPAQAQPQMAGVA